MAYKKKHSDYELVRLPLSGERCTFYSVYLTEKKITLFEEFLQVHLRDYRAELKELRGRIKAYAEKLGAKEKDFKAEGEKITDFFQALRDYPNQKLRLFCIRYGTGLVVLGGGGPKTVDKWQEDKTLTDHASWMYKVSEDIAMRVKDKEIEMRAMDFYGDLNFKQNEED